MIKELYKQWCIETKRNGAVLVGGSINEFFDWLDNEKYKLIKNDKINTNRRAAHPYVKEFDTRYEVIDFMDYANSVGTSASQILKDVSLIYNSFDLKRKIYTNNFGHAIKSILHYYDGDTCFWCGKEMLLNTENVESDSEEISKYSTIDHILPLSLGGLDNYSNIVLSCKKCNEKKGNRFWANRFIKTE